MGAGCGAGSRSILYAGAGNASGLHVVSDAEARRDVNTQLRKWRAFVRSYKGGGLPVALTRDEFRHRLAIAAARYDFTVKRLQFFQARALAPLVVIETRHYLAFARAVRVFLRSLDPDAGMFARPPCTRRLGKTILCAPSELMFLEARDELGVPLIALGMGQWARSEKLYPGPHG